MPPCNVSFIRIAMNAIEHAIDRLPRLRTIRASHFGTTILARIAVAFPDRSAAEHEAMRRAFLRHRFFNRAVYRATVHAPQAARFLARWVPVDGAGRLQRAALRNGPIIVASGHFGPVLFQLFILQRLLGRRRLYVLYKTTSPDSTRNERFLRERGMIPVTNDARGVRQLTNALLSGEPLVIAIACEAQTRGNRHAPFLATTLPVARGLGLLADLGQCPVVPWFWQWERWRPRISIGEPLIPDPQLSRIERRRAIVEWFYRILETRVARYAEQWELDLVPTVPMTASTKVRTTTPVS